jgi:O-antigen/teichoic acid export membrane protein
MIASTIFAVLVVPIYNVMFARYSGLVAAGDEAGLRGLYHLTLQMMAALTVPTAVVLFFFTRDLVLFWTGRADVAAETARIVAWLAAGMTCNALVLPAYTLQLAYAGTQVVFKISLLLIAVFAPLLFLLVGRFGPVGAAANFMAFNALLLLLLLPVTHRRLLRVPSWRVVAGDLAPGLAIGLAAALLLHAVPWGGAPLGIRACGAAAAWVVILAAIAAASPRVREAFGTRWVVLVGMWRA